MAKDGQKATIDNARAQLMARAYTKAAAAIAADTTLTLARARQIAPRVVDAVAPAIRAEHSQELAGITQREAIAVGFGSVAVLALDLAVFAAMAVRGPRWTRPAAAVAFAAHSALFAYSKHRQRTVRAAARVETARGGRV